MRATAASLHLLRTCCVPSAAAASFHSSPTSEFNGEMKTLDRGFDGKGTVLPGALPRPTWLGLGLGLG